MQKARFNLLMITTGAFAHCGQCANGFKMQIRKMSFSVSIASCHIIVLQTTLNKDPSLLLTFTHTQKKKLKMSYVRINNTTVCFLKGCRERAICRNYWFYPTNLNESFCQFTRFLTAALFYCFMSMFLC